MLISSREEDMFESLPSKSEFVAAQSSTRGLLIACIAFAFSAGAMIGMCVVGRLRNPVLGIEGVAFLGIAVWYARVLLRKLRGTEVANVK